MREPAPCVISECPDPSPTCFPGSLQAEFKAGASPSSGSNPEWLFPAARPGPPRADPGPKLTGDQTLAALWKDTMASAEGAEQRALRQETKVFVRLPNVGAAVPGWRLMALCPTNTEWNDIHHSGAPLLIF